MESLRSLVVEYQELGKQIKELKKLQADIKNRLASRLKPGEEKAGVTHVQQRRVSVSWSKVYDGLIELVPKTKLAQASKIKEENTKEYFISSFKEV